MTIGIFMMWVIGAYVCGWCGHMIYQRVTDPGVVFEFDPPIEIPAGETRKVTLNISVKDI